MTKTLYESDENERVQRPLLKDRAQDNVAVNSDQANIILYESPEKDNGNVTIISDSSKYSPKDKYFVVYITCLLFGIASLLPWNIIITATDYFVNYKLNTTESANSTYRANFTFFAGTIGNVTNVAVNLLNILVAFGGNPKKRIPYTLVLCAIVILFQVVLAIVNSEEWPFTFFILTLISVFVMFVSTGIMNSCNFYVASMFPMGYINAIIVGTNLSGIFTTLMSIISKASSPNPRIAAIYYFLSAFIALMLALIGYFLMHKMEFYIYWSRVYEENQAKSADKSENKTTKAKVPYLTILKKTWLLLFCIWLNFLSTLAIFPVYQFDIQRSCEDFFIPDLWYKDILVFLTFNVLVTIGNMLPKLIKVPGPRFIAIPVILRAIIVFVFFALCNYVPEGADRSKTWIPVVIKNDWVYWFGSALSPLAFGYFTSLLMMYTPMQVDPEHAGTASMISALVLAIGVVSGLQFTQVYKLIVLA